ncbi:hypothetical protein IW136_005506, partial [Coemansia sp. RSA 678]
MRVVQALPLWRSWVYSHVPLNTTILVWCIFSRPYIPTPGGKKTIQADIDKYWKHAVDLQQDMFKPHKRHQFVGFALTDGVSISVVRETKDKLDETKDEPDETKDKPGETSTKRKREEPQQPQQEQPAAQRVRLSYQPIVVQPQYLPALLSFQQPPAQSLYLPAQPLYLPAQPLYLPAQPLYPPVQSLYLPAQSQYPPAQPSLYLPAQSLYPPAQPLYPPVQSLYLPAQSLYPPVQSLYPPAQSLYLPAQSLYPPALPSFQQQPAQQEQPLAKNTRKRRPAQPRQKADCQYIDELTQVQLQSTAGRCVLIDPGRRDLLFAMHEDSSIEDKQLYRYTRNQQRKETRVTRFKKILEKVKPADIAEAERSLGAGSCVKPDLKLFKEYLKARAQVADKLTRFYNETYTVHPTSTHKIHK